MTDHLREDGTGFMFSTAEQAQRFRGPVKAMAAGLAHDLNNMLTGAMGFASLMKAEAEEGHAFSKYIEEILFSATRCRDITSKLIVISSSAEDNKEKVSVKEVIDRSMDMARSISEIPVSLNGSASGENVDITGDVLSLARAIAYLLSGAGFERSVTARSAVEAGQDGKGPFIRLILSGLKLDISGADSIFEPVYRDDKFPLLGYEVPFSSALISDNGGILSARTKNGELMFIIRLLPAK